MDNTPSGTNTLMKLYLKSGGKIENLELSLGLRFKLGTQFKDANDFINRIRERDVIESYLEKDEYAISHVNDIRKFKEEMNKKKCRN